MPVPSKCLHQLRGVPALCVLLPVALPAWAGWGLNVLIWARDELAQAGLLESRALVLPPRAVLTEFTVRGA